MEVQCNEGHGADVSCEERGCGRGADYALCGRHYDSLVDYQKSEGRDEAKESAVAAIEKVMKSWEGVVTIDNPVSIEGLKKEILEAIT